jgi:hypothetical protein
MLVLVDALAHVVGFFVEMALVLLGQVPVVLGHVTLFVVLQALLAAFEAGGLSRSELVIFDAVRDAVLLIGFSAVDLVDTRMSGIDLSGAGSGRIVLGLSRGRSDDHQTADCQGEQRRLDHVHARVNPREEV